MIPAHCGFLFDRFLNDLGVSSLVLCAWSRLTSACGWRSRRGMVTNHRLRRAWLLILSAGGARSDVLCRARIVRAGRRLIFGVAECSSDKGAILSHHTVTYMRTENSRSLGSG